MRSPLRPILAAAALLVLAAPLAAQQSPAQRQAERATLETRIRSLLAGVVGSGQMQARLAAQSLSLYDSLRALPPVVDTVVRVEVRTDTLRLLHVDTLTLLRVDTLRLLQVDTLVRTDTVTVLRVDTVLVDPGDLVPLPIPAELDSLPALPPAEEPPATLDSLPPPAADTLTAPPPVVGTALPELPRDSVDVSWPALSGRVISVAAGGDLQAALDSARAGDVVELQAGATWRGAYTLPARVDSGWVVVRSSAADSLPAGVRVGPADTAHLARILGGYANRPVLRTAGAASGWRLVGLEIAADTANVPAVLTAIVSLDRPSERIVLDRTYVHSTPTQGVQRCVALNNARSAIVESDLRECHAVGMDAQAIGGWSGGGPYLIRNNYLAGSGENVMFGGAAIGGGEEPSDIVIRGNLFHKPDAWRSKTPVDWAIKNLLEIKMARRLLIEDNVFDGSWADAQEGYAIIWKSENRDLARDSSLASTDITFRRNVILHSRYGIAIDGTASTARVSGRGHTSRVLIEDNTINLDGDVGRGLILLSGVRDVTVRRLRTNGRVYLENGGHRNFRMTESCTSRIMGSGMREGVTLLDARAPGWTFERNTVTDLTARWAQWYPPGDGNEYPIGPLDCLAAPAGGS